MKQSSFGSCACTCTESLRKSRERERKRVEKGGVVSFREGVYGSGMLFLVCKICRH